MTNVIDGYEIFIKDILQKLDELRIDVSNLNMDHIGYQASSNRNYDKLKPGFDKLGTMVSEVIVAQRRVGIYRFNCPLHFQQYVISALELVAPKEDQVCPSALEHVEFVLKESFASFMRRYPKIPWDTKAINQPDFPMIRLKLDKDLQVKFHLKPVLEIIA